MPRAHHHHGSVRGVRSGPGQNSGREDAPENMSDSQKPSLEPASRKTDQANASRRDFINQVALGALGIAGLGAAVVTYTYLSPNVLFEPSPTFRVGNPDLYP